MLQLHDLRVHRIRQLSLKVLIKKIGLNIVSLADWADEPSVQNTQFLLMCFRERKSKKLFFGETLKAKFCRHGHFHQGNIQQSCRPDKAPEKKKCSTTGNHWTEEWLTMASLFLSFLLRFVRAEDKQPLINSGIYEIRHENKYFFHSSLLKVFYFSFIKNTIQQSPSSEKVRYNKVIINFNLLHIAGFLF